MSNKTARRIVKVAGIVLLPVHCVITFPVYVMCKAGNSVPENMGYWKFLRTELLN